MAEPLRIAERIQPSDAGVDMISSVDRTTGGGLALIGDGVAVEELI